MGKETGIPWTDSTFNSWWGCTKVGPACDHCYAEGVDKRTGENHWGHGAPRRLLSEHARNEPMRWQKQADKFNAEHGRDRRVFTLSMGDLFDNEVDDLWRANHFRTMLECDRLEWQICTKRVSNIAKMVPSSWAPTMEFGPCWPRHVGVLITIVTQAEADRDVPRLLELKKRFGIPWVGISYEPAQERVDFTNFMSHDPLHVEAYQERRGVGLSGSAGGRVGDRLGGSGLATGGETRGSVEQGHHEADTMRASPSGARPGRIPDGPRDGERQARERAGIEVGVASLQGTDTDRPDGQSQGWQEEAQPAGQSRVGDIFGATDPRSHSAEGGPAGSVRREEQHGEVDVRAGGGNAGSQGGGRESAAARGQVRREHSAGVADMSPPPSRDGIDVVIFGGKSGSKWNDRPFSLDWAYKVRDDCEAHACSFFMKQVAAFRPTDAMIPADLMVRQWPRGH